PRELDAILLSHKHLDHSGDVNVMIEAMTSGGFRKRGVLCAPQDALSGEFVVLPYAQRFPERIEVLRPSAGPYRIGEVDLFTSLAHQHAVETYGLHFRHGDMRISYLPCGRYFDELAEDYARAAPDVLVVNVLRFADGMDVDHLTWEDAQSLVERVRPKVVVFQHFGTKMLERDPSRLAVDLEDRLGLRVIAADDGLELDLDTEVAAVVA
ncbi:MAG: MBL fold metallo-hydrolase, partial [Vulcanimicrobiaceae bacterium]